MSGINLPRSSAASIFKSYSFSSPPGGGATSYIGGYYESAAAGINLSQAGASSAFATANQPYAAHAFAVTKANGTASGGAGAVSLTVSGTSVNDSGVRTEADTETLVSDITAAGADTYYESEKKWLGQITFALSTPGPTTYALDLNGGLAKYEDFGNRSFRLTDFEFVGRAGANDTDFELELIEHKTTGWSYHATAFVPGAAAIYKMSTDHGTESDLASGKQFAWKRAALTHEIAAAGFAGLLIRVTTGAANAVTYMDAHLGIQFI